MCEVQQEESKINEGKNDSSHKLLRRSNVNAEVTIIYVKAECSKTRLLSVEDSGKAF